MDTGASISVITTAPASLVKPTQIHVTTADGKPINIEGTCTIQFKMGKENVTHDFLVAPSASNNIIGMDILLPLQCVINLASLKMYFKGGNEKLYDGIVINEAFAEKVRALESTPRQATKPSVCDLSLVPEDFRQLATDQLHRFRGLFRDQPLGFGKNYPHVIELTDPRPIKQAPRRVSAAKRVVQKQEIKKCYKKE